MKGKNREIISIIITVSIMGLVVFLVYYKIYEKAGIEWIIIIFLFLGVVYLINKVEELKEKIKKIENQK